jgi:hypothetical protein
VKAVVHDLDAADALDLFARPHAAAAQHAPVGPLFDERRHVPGHLALETLGGEILLLDAELEGEILQVALTPLVADRAVERVTDHEELQDVAPHLPELVALGRDVQPLAGRSVASGDRFADPVHLDHAHATRADGRQLLEPAQSRNANPRGLGRLEDRAPVGDADRGSVDREVDHSLLLLTVKGRKS